MRDVGIPNGLGAVGYYDSDVPDLVEGVLKQQRLLATAPLEVTRGGGGGYPAGLTGELVSAPADRPGRGGAAGPGDPSGSIPHDLRARFDPAPASR